MKTLNVILILIIFITSCNNNTAENNKFKGVNLSELEKKELMEYQIEQTPKHIINVSDFDKMISTKMINNVKYVKLESKPESLIGEISKIIVDEDMIIVLDRFVSNNLYIFSMEGKFVSKIKKFGEGPNEVLQIYDFCLDKKKKEIVVFDGKLSRITCYNYLLEPIKQHKVNFRFSNFRLLSSNKFIVSVNGSDNRHIPEIERYDILMLDSLFHIKKKGFEIDEKELNNDYTLVDHLSQINSGHVAWSPKFKNCIYEFDSSNTVSKKFELNFKNREINFEYYSQPMKELMNVAKDKNMFYFGGEYVETDSTVFFKLSTPLVKNQILIFFDKASSKYIYGKVNLDNLNLPLFSLPITSYKNQFVSFIEPQNIEMLLRNQGRNVEIPEEIKSITEQDGNPIIQFYKILPIK
jgi:hypothetical protein